MSGAHTPGPWRLVPDAYAGEDHYMVVDANNAPLFDSVNRSPAANNLTEQNDLALAAAAPMLLDALRIALSVMKLDGHDTGTAGEIVRATIAKATGAAQ